VTAFFVPPLGGKHCLPERRKTIDPRYLLDVLESGNPKEIFETVPLLKACAPLARQAAPCGHP